MQSAECTEESNTLCIISEPTGSKRTVLKKSRGEKRKISESHLYKQVPYIKWTKHTQVRPITDLLQ